MRSGSLIARPMRRSPRSMARMRPVLAFPASSPHTSITIPKPRRSHSARAQDANGAPSLGDYGRVRILEQDFEIADRGAVPRRSKHGAKIPANFSIVRIQLRIDCLADGILPRKFCQIWPGLTHVHTRSEVRNHLIEILHPAMRHQREV